MAAQVRLVEVASRPLAVARARATRATLPRRISSLMEEVYAWLRTAGIAPAGPKVVLYRDARESSLLDSEESCPIEAGVEVSGAFAGGARVVASATPEGRTAAAVHRGTYAGLPETHAAIRRWCGEAGVEIAGLCWEVYGDWSDDPERLRTEVFYLVKPT